MTVLKNLMYGTIEHHSQDSLREILGDEKEFKFKKVHCWPVSSIAFEQAELFPKEEGNPSEPSQGSLVTSLLGEAKQILAEAGFQGCNQIRYQVEDASVHYHLNAYSELFCLTPQTMPTFSQLTQSFRFLNSHADTESSSDLHSNLDSMGSKNPESGNF